MTVCNLWSKIPSVKTPDKGNITVLFFFFISSGVSAPSVTNPFQNAPSKLTLNQLSSTVSASQPSSLPYSASLPLPVGNQPASLPSSLTHPTQPGLGLLGTLPEPLLPLSSASTDESQAVQNNQNPFLWGLMELENNLRVKWECSWDITLAARLQVQGPMRTRPPIVVVSSCIMQQPVDWCELVLLVTTLISPAHLLRNTETEYETYNFHFFEAVASWKFYFRCESRQFDIKLLSLYCNNCKENVLQLFK